MKKNELGKKVTQENKGWPEMPALINLNSLGPQFISFAVLRFYPFLQNHMIGK
jgi:hypothetical protein